MLEQRTDAVLLAAGQARHEAAAGHAQAPHPATRTAAVALDVESLGVRRVLDEVVAVAAAALVATAQRAGVRNNNMYMIVVVSDSYIHVHVL